MLLQCFYWFWKGYSATCSYGHAYKLMILHVFGLFWIKFYLLNTSQKFRYDTFMTYDTVNINNTSHKQKQCDYHRTLQNLLKTQLPSVAKLRLRSETSTHSLNGITEPLRGKNLLTVLKYLIYLIKWTQIRSHIPWYHT